MIVTSATSNTCKYNFEILNSFSNIAVQAAERNLPTPDLTKKTSWPSRIPIQNGLLPIPTTRLQPVNTIKINNATNNTLFLIN